MTGQRSFRRTIDWGELAPLRLRAREVADGVFAGAHRSVRRGAGIEFGGYREYVAGDDLRWLDRRALLRHDRLVVRQFEMETDRALALVVDASASMAFRGPHARWPKIAYAGLVAAALARIALASADPVSLTFVGGGGQGTPISRSAGREQFERVVAALEAVEPHGDAWLDLRLVERALQAVARSTRRGAIVVVLSDLIDLPEGSAERFGELASTGRVLAVVQTLDPAESEFPYGGTVRLRAMEGDAVVETDADAMRARYLSALAKLSATWERAVVARGGRFLRTTSSDAPVEVVREIVRSVR